MSPPLVLIAHAPSAEERAAEIATQLAALGYAVDALPEAPRARNARLNAAHKLIVLWSHDAARVPNLRVIARMARAMGKLACVRLDGAKPPPGLCSKVSIRLPRGRAQSTAWRRLLQGRRARGADTLSTSTHAAAIAEPASPASGGSRLTGIAVAASFALMVAGALYIVDSDFAARVNAFAGNAHARAGAIVDTFKTQSERDG